MAHSIEVKLNKIGHLTLEVERFRIYVQNDIEVEGLLDELDLDKEKMIPDISYPIKASEDFLLFLDGRLSEII